MPGRRLGSLPELSTDTQLCTAEATPRSGVAGDGAEGVASDPYRFECHNPRTWLAWDASLFSIPHAATSQPPAEAATSNITRHHARDGNRLPQDKPRATRHQHAAA